MSDEFKHYGIKRKSGRYPWGSGDDQYQNSLDFYAFVDDIKKNAPNMPDKEIARAIGLSLLERPGEKEFSVSDLRSTRTIAKEAIVREQTNRAVTLRDKGVSIQAIADELGIPAPTVRLRLKNSEDMKASTLTNTAEVLRKNVDQYDIIDIGKGTEYSIDTGTRMGISPEKLKAATALLRDEGYVTYNLQVPQVGTRQFTNTKVLVKPGTTYGEAKKMTDRIHTLGEWTEDEGRSFSGILPPLNVSSKRLKVVYAEDGGAEQDGVVFVRRGVKDLDMGKNTYAQVRIGIDGTHFIKGMAVLSDDLPPGVDMLFNTNKKRGTPVLGTADNTVLKLQKGDDDPFGSIIKRQILENDPKTGEKRVTSALNLVNEEGDWDIWRKSVPSQMLAKQPHSLIKSQLAETRAQTQDRIDEINRITNPVVRRATMEKFAERIDSDAVDLRAAAMPRQRTQVILPLPKMAKNEIYAPNFETGEKVVLIRFPHGGRFEIPEVTVNNNSRIAKKLLGNATDAIGIHPSVAARLSGADFDGDTVVVIPNRQGKVKGVQSMGSAAKVYEDGLKNFEPQRKYGGYEVLQPGVGKKGDANYRPEVGNFKLMTNTGLEMGMITNLITDMSIQGAKPEHVVRAVRHSMVVIDAEKHKLDYKRSEQDNGIKQLKALYQGDSKAGASTLLSRATARERIDERKPRSAKNGGPVDPLTGKKMYEETGRSNNKFDPKTNTYLQDTKVKVQEQPKRLALTDDAYTLVRDKTDPVERLYADHANAMKDMANKARLKALHTAIPPRNPKAALEFKAEVDQLKADYKAALKQAPIDRRANVVAGAAVKAMMKEDPLLRTDSDRKKKAERRAKDAARARLGLKKPTIKISDAQWDAIMAGAVSPSMLRDMLRFTDAKEIEERALPRANAVMTKAVLARAKRMLAGGATNADVAAALGIAPSTLRTAAVRGELS